MKLEWTIKHNHIILENVSKTVYMMYQTMINVYILVNDLIPFKVDLVERNHNNNKKMLNCWHHLQPNVPFFFSFAFLYSQNRSSLFISR